MPRVITQSPRYKWILVGMLFVISGLNYADRTALSSVLSVLRADLGLTDVQLGVAASAFFWVYAIGIAVSGFIADRVSRSRLIVVSLTLWSLVTLATAKGTELENTSYEGQGSENMVAEQMAGVLRGMNPIILSDTGKTGSFNPLDLDAVMKMFGSNKGGTP